MTVSNALRPDFDPGIRGRESATPHDGQPSPATKEYRSTASALRGLGGTRLGQLGRLVEEGRDRLSAFGHTANGALAAVKESAPFRLNAMLPSRPGQSAEPVQGNWTSQASSAWADALPAAAHPGGRSALPRAALGLAVMALPVLLNPMALLGAAVIGPYFVRNMLFGVAGNALDQLAASLLPRVFGARPSIPPPVNWCPQASSAYGKMPAWKPPLKQFAYKPDIPPVQTETVETEPEVPSQAQARPQARPQGQARPSAPPPNEKPDLPPRPQADSGPGRTADSHADGGPGRTPDSDAQTASGSEPKPADARPDARASGAAADNPPSEAAGPHSAKPASTAGTAGPANAQASAPKPVSEAENLALVSRLNGLPDSTPWHAVLGLDAGASEEAITAAHDALEHIVRSTKHPVLDPGHQSALKRLAQARTAGRNELAKTEIATVTQKLAADIDRVKAKIDEHNRKKYEVGLRHAPGTLEYDALVRPIENAILGHQNEIKTLYRNYFGVTEGDKDNVVTSQWLKKYRLLANSIQNNSAHEYKALQALLNDGRALLKTQ